MEITVIDMYAVTDKAPLTDLDARTLTDEGHVIIEVRLRTERHYTIGVTRLYIDRASLISWALHPTKCNPAVETDASCAGKHHRNHQIGVTSNICTRPLRAVPGDSQLVKKQGSASAYPWSEALLYAAMLVDRHGAVHVPFRQAL